VPLRDERNEPERHYPGDVNPSEEEWVEAWHEHRTRQDEATLGELVVEAMMLDAPGIGAVAVECVYDRSALEYRVRWRTTVGHVRVTFDSSRGKDKRELPHEGAARAYMWVQVNSLLSYEGRS